ncbi:MAG: hypothetical protein M1813_006226 [Trichoglossum hirsutum]|nr:MAG: hypothetical protein M1813_006226 [Trichoglossum hirsutum]
MAAQHIGSGLTEVAAVATLIGAPIAEALMHGLKAAAGLAWAPNSTFGAIHVTKACLAASIPDWLRESCGLRNSYVDAAIGVMLPHYEGIQSRSRQDLGDAQAMLIESVKKDEYSRVEEVLHDPIAATELALVSSSSLDPEKPLTRRPVRAMTDLMRPAPLATLTGKRPLPKTTCIYTLDRGTQLILDTVQRTERHDPIPIHSYHPDQDGATPPWKDWLVILCSSLKIVEALTLWHLQAHVLWYITLVGWGHAFLSAIILQTLRLGRDDNRRHTASDLIAGILPTPLHHGDNGKIVLGVPFNVRRSLFWRCLLGLGAISNGVGIVGSFLYVGKQTSRVVYTWIAFQVFFLVCRPVVYYFVEGATARQGVIGFKSYAESDVGSRRRTMALMTALASHQVSIHPRGVGAYKHDVIRYETIAACFMRAEWRLTLALPRNRFVGSGKVTSITLVATVGDPFLRSILWLGGLDVNNADVYDTCLAFLRISGGRGEKGGAQEEMHFAVPCVRFWSCNCMREGGQRQRGNAHPPVCGKIQWFYCFPLVQEILDGEHGVAVEREVEREGEEAGLGKGGGTPEEDEIIQIDTPVEERPKGELAFPEPVTYPMLPTNSELSKAETGRSITTGKERWIHAYGFARERVLGYESWTDEELQRRLTLKEWNISLQKAEEVHASLAVSRQASEEVREKLMSAAEGASGL